MKIKLFLAILILFFPLSLVFAETDMATMKELDNNLEENSLLIDSLTPIETINFKAKIDEVIEEKIELREDGFQSIKQDLILIALNTDLKNQKLEYSNLLNEFDVIVNNRYKKGNKVIAQKIIYKNGDERIFILDYDRENYLYLLGFIFIITIILIGRKKGIRSIIGLILSFLIIVKFILPQILNGANPLLIALVGSSLILLLIIYINEGFNKKSHISVLSVFITLTITLLLAVVFSSLTKLTGLSQEEALFLIGRTKQAIDFRGLMLAGFLIGAVGVLDDVIVGQVETVRQLKEANPNFTQKELFKSAYKIGNTHLGAITNTLFLTYTGASLPLLLLFTINQEPFITFSQVINNEIVAIEIVRTLVGSIGVALSLPIATYLAIKFIFNEKPEKNNICIPKKFKL